MKSLLKIFNINVIVVCGVHYGIVQDCRVFWSIKKALVYRDELIKIYGGSAVYLASRAIW